MFNPTLNTFIKNFNPEQYEVFKIDKLHAFHFLEAIFFVFTNMEERMDNHFRDARQRLSVVQAKTLEQYKTKQNKLFNLLLQKDKYGNPNIESLQFKNVSQILSIFKDEPDKLEKLLTIFLKVGTSQNEISQLSFLDKDTVINIISSIENKPILLDKILLPVDKNTGKTILHIWCKKQEVDILNAINKAYSNRPDVLLKMYSVKDFKDVTTVHFGVDETNATEFCTRTPLEYLSSENKEQVRNNCSILQNLCNDAS